MAAADSTAAGRAYLNNLDHALLADNTHKGYKADWSYFRRWCEREGFPSLPATTETLSLYIAVRLCEPKKVSTVMRHVSAVNHMHKRSAVESPVNHRVHELLRAARRLRGEHVRQVKALTIEDVREISRDLATEDTPIAVRNKAIVLIGFASSLRSASLVDLTLDDIQWGPEGLTLLIRREKQDQECKGRIIGIPYGRSPETCPPTALKAWLTRRGSYAGPVFVACNNTKPRRPLQAEQICRIVQACLLRIGRTPQEYGSHSLRAGFVTAAAEAGCSELLVAAQTGHKDMGILRQYFRKADLFRSNACARLDL